MGAAHTDKIILIFCEYKNHSKENNSTILLWHLESLSGKFRYRNQTNVLILSWSDFFQKWISKSNPDPKKLQASCRISNLDPVHAHLCQILKKIHWIWKNHYFYVEVNSFAWSH